MGISLMTFDTGSAFPGQVSYPLPAKNEPVLLPPSPPHRAAAHTLWTRGFNLPMLVQSATAAEPCSPVPWFEHSFCALTRSTDGQPQH